MHCEVIRFCWPHHVKSAQIFLGEWECERVLLRAGLLEPGRAGRHVVLGVRPRHGLVLRAGPARAHSPLGRAVLVSGQKTGFVPCRRASGCMNIYTQHNWKDKREKLMPKKFKLCHQILTSTESKEVK